MAAENFSEGRGREMEDCGCCEVGRCDLCDGLTIEGFPCDCAEANHYDALADYEDYADCTTPSPAAGSVRGNDAGVARQKTRRRNENRN